MVVCKCRKATKLYCFVHKTPVCFDCICAPDHQHCVVWQYSDWVNDGDYDWPPHCAVCSESLEDSDKPTIRLSCLHVPHAECVKRHVESFPPNTAPAGFTCASPGCGLEIWPARSHKDSASALYTHLRALLAQTSVADVILSAPVTSDPAAASAQATALSDKSVPPAFASGPLAVVGRAADPASAGAEGEARGEAGGAVEERNGGEGEGSGAGSSGGAAAAVAAAAAAAAAAASAGAKRQAQQQGGVNIARSRTGGSDRTAVDITEEIETAYRTDEEAGDRKYARRGPAHLQLLRVLGSWWSPALHALPVTLTATHSHRRDKDDHAPVGAHEEGRRRAGQRRSGGVDPRKLLLIVAVVSCMATMLLLYYRLAQGAMSEGASTLSH
ncbi:unnamed protein product [Closterium sp. Yama58-4]|nr:unnamed protein product [Closterium sp. Yama58-4]